jgi:hypothetical protein
MNPNSTALSNLSNASLRANSPAGNSTAAPVLTAPGTPIAPASTEFSRMLANNQASARQASARQASARQNNAVNQGKFTVAPKTPDAPAQPSGSRRAARQIGRAATRAVIFTIKARSFFLGRAVVARPSHSGRAVVY